MKDNELNEKTKKIPLWLNPEEEVKAIYVRDFLISIETKLIPTQNKICIPIINRLCRKMAIGLKFNKIKVDGDLIIDGHHRYISSVITGFMIDSVPSTKTLVTKSYNWSDILFDDNDWDTESKILHLNKQDATYNNLELDTLKQLIQYKNKS